MRKIPYILKYWLPLAAALTGVFAFIYLTVQQDMRMGLDDPQIQMAEDAASALASNQPVDALFPAGAPKVDMAKSLAPFLIVYDTTAARLPQARAERAGARPACRRLRLLRQNNEDRVSWQPAPDVRSAAVIVAVPGRAGRFCPGRA